MVAIVDFGCEDRDCILEPMAAKRAIGKPELDLIGPRGDASAHRMQIAVRIDQTGRAR